MKLNIDIISIGGNTVLNQEKHENIGDNVEKC